MNKEIFDHLFALLEKTDLAGLGESIFGRSFGTDCKLCRRRCKALSLSIQLSGTLVNAEGTA